MIRSDKHLNEFNRYQRQIVFSGLGWGGQKQLFHSRVLIIGVGGLGSWNAEILARAGVGFIRIVDPDRVDITNLHRQALYDQADAGRAQLKVQAAEHRLRRINSTIQIDPVADRLEADNIHTLAHDVDLILDGTDQFATRFLINDYCVKTGTPWIFAGVIGGGAQVVTFIPGRTGCLRCLLDEPPLPCHDPGCRQMGVLGPAVAAIAGLQSMEALKLLAGQTGHAGHCLTWIDVWNNTVRQIDLTTLKERNDCPCCNGHEYAYLEP